MRYHVGPMRVMADESRMGALISELAERIGGAMREGESWALVGIRSRGDLIAQRLAERIGAARLGGRKVGALDITLYRDDLSEVGAQAVVRTTEIPFDLDGVNIVLVDDVLMTGRSVRAAMQSLIDLGRPRRIWLAVLVDRGGRELPIAPDFVGLDLRAQSPADGEQVRVSVRPFDAADRITVEKRA